MRNDGCFRTERGVAACVVAVPVCVEHKLQLAFAQSFQCCLNLLCERRILIVNVNCRPTNRPLFAAGALA